MSNALSPILGPLGLDPSAGYDTAAAGAQQAAGQANALSQLQWQRQMQGLQGALGYVGNLQSLYNSMYGPGGGQVAPGGGNNTHITPSAIAAGTGKTPAPPPTGQGNTGLGNLKYLSPAYDAYAGGKYLLDKL